MSLLLAGLVLAGTSGAVLVGRWLARARGEKPTEEKPAEEKPKEAEEKPKPAPRAVTGERVKLEGFPCQLGDVVMRMTGEEAWLAGGLVLSETIPVAALFVAPDAVHDTAIYARAESAHRLVWLEPIDPSVILVGGEPPSAVEHAGIRFERTRRLPLRPKRVGTGAPQVGDAVIVAEYASAGAERMVVLKGNAGSVHAFRGVEIEEGAYEVIASGDATLE